MIYCVVPPELEAELYDKLVAYYAGNPNVTVIVDRRSGADRRRERAAAPEQADQRHTRDRRRPRAPGTFPRIDSPEA